MQETNVPTSWLTLTLIVDMNILPLSQRVHEFFRTAIEESTNLQQKLSPLPECANFGIALPSTRHVESKRLAIHSSMTPPSSSASTSVAIQHLASTAQRAGSSETRAGKSRAPHTTLICTMSCSVFAQAQPTTVGRIKFDARNDEDGNPDPPAPPAANSVISSGFTAPRVR